MNSKTPKQQQWINDVGLYRIEVLTSSLDVTYYFDKAHKVLHPYSIREFKTGTTTRTRLEKFEATLKKALEELSR